MTINAIPTYAVVDITEQDQELVADAEDIQLKVMSVILFRKRYIIMDINKILKSDYLDILYDGKNKNMEVIS